MSRIICFIDKNGMIHKIILKPKGLQLVKSIVKLL